MAAKTAKSRIWLIVWGIAVAALLAVGIERFSAYNQTLQENTGKEERLFSAAKAATRVNQLEQERSALLELQEIETGYRYTPEEIDAYRFGILVNNLLESNDIDVTSTKMTGTAGTTSLEYIFQGSPPGIMQFLREVALHEKRLEISYLSLSAQTDGARMFAVMRITYAQVS